MANYYELPLVLSTDISTTFKKIREIAKVNSDIIRIEKDIDLNLNLRGLGGNSNFYFNVGEPKLNANATNTTYIAHYSPRSHASISPQKQETVGESILKLLSNWLATLQRYNTISIHPTDSITDQYEDEFEDWFEIVDEDADMNAFDTPRQILISNIITKSVDALKEEGYHEDDEVIQEAEELKGNISKLTKKQVFNGIKTIYAKLKINGGWDKVKLVYEVCEKEVIKMGFHIGAKYLGEKLANLLVLLVN